MAETTKKVTSKKQEESASLQISVYDLSGKEVKQIDLSKDLFDTKINKQLLAQYMRVYLANQRQGTASTKHRSEVVGSTKKIYRQKGTGNARHGSRKAPIFVGGGVQAGPKPRDYSLSMNKKQKRQALLASLSLKAQEGAITGLANEAVDMKIKTKDFATFISKSGHDNVKTLVVLSEVKKNGLVMSARNIENITIAQATTINPYMLLNSKKIIFVEDALTKLEDHFLKNNES